MSVDFKLSYIYMLFSLFCCDSGLEDRYKLLAASTPHVYSIRVCVSMGQFLQVCLDTHTHTLTHIHMHRHTNTHTHTRVYNESYLGSIFFFFFYVILNREDRYPTYSVTLSHDYVISKYFMHDIYIFIDNYIICS